MKRKLAIILILIVIIAIVVILVSHEEIEMSNKVIENSTQENLVVNQIQENEVEIEDNDTNEISMKEDAKVETIKISVNNRELIVRLEDNSSSQALVEKLQEGDIVINAHDYGNFEKVGDLGFSLPRNDKNITTESGDLILYQGNQITLYYDTNSWSFTKLGKVQNASQSELKEILGDGNVTLVLSLD